MATVGTDMELNDLLDFSAVSRGDCSAGFNNTSWLVDIRCQETAVYCDYVVW